MEHFERGPGFLLFATVLGVGSILIVHGLHLLLSKNSAQRNRFKSLSRSFLSECLVFGIVHLGLNFLFVQMHFVLYDINAAQYSFTGKGPSFPELDKQTRATVKPEMWQRALFPPPWRKTCFSSKPTHCQVAEQTVQRLDTSMAWSNFYNKGFYASASFFLLFWGAVFSGLVGGGYSLYLLRQNLSA